MLKYVFAFIAVIFLALLAGAFAVSRMPKTNTQGFSLDAADASSQSFDELMKGTVTKVVEQDAEQSRHLSRITATLEVKLMSGSQKGETITAVYDDMLADERLQKVSEGDAIVVGRLAMPDETSYVMVDRYRLPYLAIAGAIFLALAAVFGRARGLTSVAGLMA
ncbi:MAG TPA: hypothetical protein VHA30_00275, partial [Patescibacteria group bacterium]|nr:hypothetical protein [Patescibacteria group bacterium]